MFGYGRDADRVFVEIVKIEHLFCFVRSLEDCILLSRWAWCYGSVSL